ncbi:hypothetical protein [Geodermatophilus sp. SYSU D01119]
MTAVVVVAVVAALCSMALLVQRARNGAERRAGTWNAAGGYGVGHGHSARYLAGGAAGYSADAGGGFDAGGGGGGGDGGGGC